MTQSIAQSYMPVFTGAQAIELAGRAPWWTPQIFNAKADGIHNDTIAVQAAIDSCGAAGGGVVFFPEGTYLISAITVSSPNVYLVGSGIQNTIIKKSTSAADTAAITISASYCGVSNLTIKGVSVASFVGNETAIDIVGVNDSTRRSNCIVDKVEVYDIGSYGVQAYYAKHLRVTNCYIHDVGYAGIGIWASDYSIVTGNQIHTVTPGTSSNVYGIFFSHKAVSDTRLKFAICSDNQIYNLPIWEALDTHGGTHVTFSNNTIFECKRGIVAGIDTLNSYVPNYCNITNNTIDAGTLSTVDCGIIYAGVDGGADVYGGVIDGNIIRNHGNTNIDFGAIYVYDTNGLVISSNNIYNSKGVGISLYRNNTGLVIQGNAINGIQAGVANATGIIARSTGNTGLISDNYVDATAEIALYATASNTSLQFGRNIFTSSGSPILAGVELLGRGLEIYGNLTFDPGALIDGQGTDANIPVTGANLGDAVEFSAPYSLQGLTVTGYVQSVNTVYLRLQNETGGPIDLGNGNWKIKVTKM